MCSVLQSIGASSKVYLRHGTVVGFLRSKVGEKDNGDCRFDSTARQGMWAIRRLGRLSYVEQ